MNQIMKILSVQTLGLLMASQGFAQQTTFVEACLGDTPILTHTLICQAITDDSKTAVEFTLVNAARLKSRAQGRFGNFSKSDRVVQIVNMPPQLTQMGFVGESLQFRVEKLGSTGPMITIPCHQSNAAIIGESKEAWASCSIK